MENFIVIAILVVIIGLAGFYIYRAKKQGKKCIGCPYCDSCMSKNNSGCCSSSADKKQ